MEYSIARERLRGAWCLTRFVSFDPPIVAERRRRFAMARRQPGDAVAHSVERQTELDWLRGLMLVLMTITHMPTWFSNQLGQPFGFVSAAEGFVFLSAYLVGSVYMRTAHTRGYAAMRRAIWRRALKVYAAHAGLLLFLLWLLVPIALHRGAHSVTDLASFYIAHPHLALACGLLLAYNPPLLDILPMYVLFLLVSPFVLEHGTRRGWAPLMTLGALLWLFSQIGGGRQVYQSVAALVDWPVPYSQTGAFSLLAWQLLWLIGLRAGAQAATARAEGSAPQPWPAPLVMAAVLIATVFFVWRHLVGQVPFGPDAALNALFDKWHLGALRLLDFGAIAIVVVWARPAIVAWARHSAIATLGRSSLTVFSAQLVLCLALLVIIEEAPPHLHLQDGVVLVGTLLALYAIARVTESGGGAIRTGWKTIALRLSARTVR